MMARKMTPTTQMTSSEFVSFAETIARDTASWDDASDVFPGRPRWETVELETSIASSEDSAQTPV
jgi:hypothetical protein